MMKNIMAALAVAAIFMSCKKNPDASKLSNETDKIEGDSLKLEIDSVAVFDSLRTKNSFTSYSQKTLIFNGLKKEVLDSLYQGELYDSTNVMSDYSKDTVFKRLSDLKDNFFKASDIGDLEVDREQVNDHESKMKVVSNIADFLTVNYFGEWYGGGAHGGMDSSFKTVDLKEQKIVQLQDILDVNRIKWQPILIKHVDKELLFDENININRNFYFDKNSITFVYNQYEIGPYSSSIIEIKIPFSEIKQALHPEFKKRLNIN